MWLSGNPFWEQGQAEAKATQAARLTGIPVASGRPLR